MTLMLLLACADPTAKPAPWTCSIQAPTAVAGPAADLWARLDVGYTPYGIGDLDGDGLGELATYDQRSLFLWLGSAEPPDEVPDFVLPASYGAAANVGDIDGDGAPDLAIAEMSSNFVYFASAAEGFSFTYDRVWEGFVEAEGFGTRIVPLGDVTGDGLADLAVGVSDGDVVYVLPGTDGARPEAIAELRRSGDAILGDRIVAADIDGDGARDLVGYYGYEIFAFTSGFSEQASWSTDLAVQGLANAGDLDGDGAEDVVLVGDGALHVLYGGDGLDAGLVELDDGGCPGASNVASRVDGARGFVVTANDFGRLDGAGACVYNGTELLLVSQAPAAGGVWMNAPAADLGDLDGDGWPDVAVGAHEYSSGIASTWVLRGCPTEDGDGDGFLGGACGGPDCDDADAAVYPGASDQAGDGVDADCDGADPPAPDADDCGCATDPVEASPSYGIVAAEVGEGAGYTWALGGDIDGDGYGDLLAGAPISGAGDSTGAVYVLRGSEDGLVTSPWDAAFGTEVNAYFGNYVVGAGDVDGDGFDDVVAVSGTTLSFFRGGSGGLSAPTTQTTPAWPRPAGDLDGDGFDDLVARTSDDYAPTETTLLLWEGRAGGLGDEPTQVVIEGAAGTAVGLGDVDGDGHPDIGVGLGDLGRAQVHLGGPAGVGSEPAWAWSGEIGYGSQVTGLGDIDGDGSVEVAVTVAPRGVDRTVVVFRGGSGGDAEPSATISATGVAAGDLDGDGLAELVVPGDGGFAVSCGDPRGLSATNATWLDLPDARSWVDNDGAFGGALIGDFDGDGVGDLALGVAEDGEWGAGTGLQVFEGRAARGGCACGSTRSGGGPGLVLVAALLLGVRRRRSSSSALTDSTFHLAASPRDDGIFRMIPWNMWHRFRNASGITPATPRILPPRPPPPAA